MYDFKSLANVKANANANAKANANANDMMIIDIGAIWLFGGEMSKRF